MIDIKMLMRRTFYRVALILLGLNSCGGLYQPLQVCEQGLVQVTSITVVCNTPVSSSYVRGSHYNSNTCGYGDYAKITVAFDVGYDYGDEIYMQLNVSSNENETVYESGSKSLCGNYQTPVCGYQGSYNFTTRVQFDFFDGNATSFLPLVTMAFSHGENGEPDLGGVNIDCMEKNSTNTTEQESDGDDRDEENNEDMYGRNDTLKWGGASAIAAYSALAAIFAAAFLAGFCWIQSNRKEARNKERKQQVLIDSADRTGKTLDIECNQDVKNNPNVAEQVNGSTVISNLNILSEKPTGNNPIENGVHENYNLMGNDDTATESLTSM